MVVLFAAPQMPGPAIWCSLQLQLAELLPLVQVQIHWPLPVSVTLHWQSRLRIDLGVRCRCRMFRPIGAAAGIGRHSTSAALTVQLQGLSKLPDWLGHYCRSNTSSIHHL